MKAYLIMAALAITNAYSTRTSIYWGEDSSTAFNLTIAGTGIDYRETIPSPRGPNGTQNIYSETFTSPSGLWELRCRHGGERRIRPRYCRPCWHQ